MAKRMFELVKGTSKKFWEVWTRGSSVHTRYGTIGSAGQTKVKDEKSPVAAKKLRDKLVAEKMKKGYVEPGAAPKAKPIVIVFRVASSPLPDALCYAYRSEQELPKRHTKRLPDASTPHDDAMLEAIDERTSEEILYQQLYSDDELADLEGFQLSFAFKPLVDDPAVLRGALERDGFEVSDLLVESSDPGAVDELARHLSLTSENLLTFEYYAGICNDLAYHATSVVERLRAAFASKPADADRFVSGAKRASASWSPSMRDRFLLLLAYAVLRPMSEAPGPDDESKVMPIKALIAALPTEHPRVREELREWVTGLDLTLESVLANLASITDAKRRLPASDAELSMIERALGEVPAELRELYGFARDLDAIFRGVRLEWLKIDESVKACAMNRECHAPESLWPIAGDRAGNYACFDRDTRRILDWDHETRETSALAPTLASYLHKGVLRELRDDA